LKFVPIAEAEHIMNLRITRLVRRALRANYSRYKWRGSRNLIREISLLSSNTVGLMGHFGV
jgi:hypothetical protein